MSSIQEVLDGITALNAQLTDVIQVKLDAIQDIVSQLKAGQVSQAQIDALAAAVSGAKSAADAIVADEDSTINNP